ncbi:MAG: hypothetical protein AB3N20_09565 [Rhizobiaceae bacterium]
MWLERHSGKLALLAIAVFAATAAIDKALFTVTPLEIPPPDAHTFGISEETLGFWLEAMKGERATQFLLLHTFTFDLVLPALIVAALVGWTLRFANRLPRFAAMAAGWKLALVLLPPLLYAVSDWSENALTAVLLLEKAAAGSQIGGLLAASTTLKFTFLILALIILLAAYLAARRSNKI